MESVLEERRKYPRFPVHYDVLCKDIDDPGQKPIRGIAENASRTGLKLRIPGHAINPRAQLKIEILKNLSARPINCFGKVVWESESTLVYGERVAGIQITKIGWSETDKLITNLDI